MVKAGSPKKSLMDKAQSPIKSLMDKAGPPKRSLSDKARVSKKSSMSKARALNKSLLEKYNKLKSKQLNELRKENEFCDLTLKCEDGFEIKVHRVVVCSGSNYFKDLLTYRIKDKFEESILLPEITGDVLQNIITFIYTSEFEEEIEDYGKFIQYAMSFQLNELVEICLRVLSEYINDGNCVKYWQIAKKYHNSEDKFLTYIINRAEYLFESSLMSDLTIEEMRFLLADNRLHLHRNEKKLFEYVWKWAEGIVSETNSFSEVFSEVIDLLDFSKLENEFVFQKMFSNKNALTNPKLLNKVSELTKPKFKDDVASHHIIHKSSQREGRFIGLAPNKMFIGLGEENTIEKEVNFRLGFGYTTFENKLLICGGKVEDYSVTNSCESFDPKTQQWQAFPSMKTERRFHGCSYLDNKIYACGGFNSNTVEIFDFAEGKWNYGPEMPATNWHFGLTDLDGALYTIGGQTNNIERFDPRLDKWNVVYSDPRIHKYVRCVSIGPYIYCFTFDNIYIFDPRSIKFTTEIRFTGFDCDFNLCALDDYIYGFGYNPAGKKYSLNFVKYNRDGAQKFTKSYGLYNKDEVTPPAIVSLYY